MSRKELYQRTKGCTIYGVSLFVTCAILALAVAAIWNSEHPSHIGTILGFLFLFYCLEAMVLFLSYRNYWLDLLKKETAAFEGTVFSGGPISGAVLETGWNWRLIETGTDTPQQFFLCLPPMEKRYPNDRLIQELCCGPASFHYLKRSRYIVEITSLSKPEPDKRSKHAQKKARRKALRQSAK